MQDSAGFEWLTRDDGLTWTLSGYLQTWDLCVTRIGAEEETAHLIYLCEAIAHGADEAPLSDLAFDLCPAMDRSREIAVSGRYPD